MEGRGRHEAPSRREVVYQGFNFLTAEAIAIEGCFQ